MQGANESALLFLLFVRSISVRWLFFVFIFLFCLTLCNHFMFWVLAYCLTFSFLWKLKEKQLKYKFQFLFLPFGLLFDFDQRFAFFFPYLSQNRVLKVVYSFFVCASDFISCIRFFLSLFFISTLFILFKHISIEVSTKSNTQYS